MIGSFSGGPVLCQGKAAHPEPTPLPRPGLYPRHFQRQGPCATLASGGEAPISGAMIDNVHTAGALVPVAGQEELVRRRFWGKVRRTLGRVPFMEQVLAAYYCATDATTPIHVKAVLFAALAYFILPADMIPDFMAVIGFSDDAAVLLAAVQALAPHIRDRHRERAWAFLDSNTP